MFGEAPLSASWIHIPQPSLGLCAHEHIEGSGNRAWQIPVTDLDKVIDGCLDVLERAAKLASPASQYPFSRMPCLQMHLRSVQHFHATLACHCSQYI